MIGWAFPDPASATTPQVAFALQACETRLHDNADASTDDDRAFFLSALFAIAAVCRADLHYRLAHSATDDELNRMIANGGREVFGDQDDSG
ncbi:MAG: hypothetical protein ACLPVY_22270 [Acidimicrobiia bacterium]